MDELRLLLAASGIYFTTYNTFISSSQDLPSKRQWLVSGDGRVFYIHNLDRGEYRCVQWGTDIQSVAAKVVEIEHG